MAHAYVETGEANAKLWSLLFEYRPPEGRALPEWYKSVLGRPVEGVHRAVRPAFSSATQCADFVAAIWVALHGVVALRDQGMATSGDYRDFYEEQGERRSHIIDPRTGYSPRAVASATVVAPDAALADALATLAMTLAPARTLDLVESMPGCECYLVRRDLRALRSSGMDVTPA